MKARNYMNAAACKKAAETLRVYNEGLEDLSTLNDKIVVSANKVENAVDQFEYYADQGGGYFSNIINTPHFTMKEIEVILSYL